MLLDGMIQHLFGESEGQRHACSGSYLDGIHSFVDFFGKGNAILGANIRAHPSLTDFGFNARQ